MKQIKTKAMVTKIANMVKKEIEKELAIYDREDSKFSVKVVDVCEGIKYVIVKRERFSLNSIGQIPVKEAFDAFNRVAGDYAGAYCTIEAYMEKGEPKPMIVCGISIDNI